jgi:hypothetical protein
MGGNQTQRKVFLIGLFPPLFIGGSSK